MTTLETVRVELAPPGASSAAMPRAVSPPPHVSSAPLAAANPDVPPKRAHREVRFGSYILGSNLGEGEFGKVKLGWRKDGKLPSQVAIKLIKRESLAKDSESEVKIHREINSLKMLSHPNIVKLVEVMKSGKYIGIVLEYCSGGELFEYILQHKYLKESVAKKLFAQLVSGVDYMHSKGLVHRDLKLENLLLDKHKNVIISDFGFVNSYRDHDLMKTSCGSPCYAAPELVLSQQRYHGRKVDIWSLGVILYAMLAGYLPFDDDPENEDGSDIVRLYQYICKTPLTFPEYVSPLARDLLRKIIVPDPKRRVDMDQIRTHPWLQHHANLLQIRQPEWDRMARERAPVQPAPRSAASKRYSMIQESTTSNLLSATPKAASSTSSSFASAVALPRPVRQGHARSTSHQIDPLVVATTAASSNPIANGTTNNTNVAPGTSSVDPSPPSTISSYGSVTPSRPTSSIGGVGVNSASELGSNESTFITPNAVSMTGATRITPSEVVANGGTLVAPTPRTAIASRQQGAFSQASTTRLPHQKPRPTSYHPTLTPSLLTDLYRAPLSTSPTKAPPLSQTTDENASPERSPKTKRDSALFYLEDKMEQLDLRDAVAEKPPPVPQKDNAQYVSRNSPQTASKSTIDKGKTITSGTTATSAPPPVPPKEQRRVSQYGTGGYQNSSVTNSLVPEVSTRPVSMIVPPTSQTIPKRSQSTHDSGRRVLSGGDDDKENKRKNRFSILSFYSGYNSSTQSVSALVREKERNLAKEKANESTKPSHGKDQVKDTSLPKRPLEPSKEHNITGTATKRNVSTSSTGSKCSTTSTASSVQGKEASAARKVMDFFKRRSVRLGS
ncbi:hypothetical protein DIURU_002002 [Diutina rugosa]|uniref:non-specific serine/threonine protein kinase n=1 Tax=Diutina rugosa TaxID=5481 RepID=A0A642URK8_DIURU|nr:uncharacterized protein DIURU_002002 [Diutina rugosa]KAA8904050.1 hypothetical protein DIURU_002002 [Diutina rugosa]